MTNGNATPPLPDEEPAGRNERARVGSLRWFLRNRFQIIDGYLAEIEAPTHAKDLARLRARFERSITLAKRVLTIRLVVTVLLALGIITTAFASIINVLDLEGEAATGARTIGQLMARVAATSGSITVVLLGIRLGCDRYLSLVDASLTYIGMQIATVPR